MEQGIFFEPGEGIAVSARGSSMLFKAVTVRERGKGWATTFTGWTPTAHISGESRRAIPIEHHGFKAVQFGISPSPESAPDVEYHWRP
jgi:hypothetical protein